MAVKLRLARHGSKKNPFYRIVAADERNRRDGRFLEQLGTYDPAYKPAAVALKRDRVTYWLSTGAQPTDTVRNILDQFMDSADTAIRSIKRKPGVQPAAAPKAEAPAPKAEAAPAPKAEAAPEAPAAPAEAPASEA